MKRFSPARHLTPALAALSLLGLPSLSSAQMLGVIPQKRPKATGDTYRDYDWTGLTLTWSWQLAYVPGWFLAGADYNYFGGNYAHNVYTYDVFGNGWENSATRMDLTGTSTYKWKWVPPNKVDAQGNDLGVPDLDNFPLPNLFLLERVQSRISAQLQQNAGYYVFADGKLLDGFTPDPQVKQFNTVCPPTISVDTMTAPAYQLIAAIPPTDGTNLFTDLLSPPPYVEGNPDQVTPGAGELRLYCEEHSFALHLTDTNQQGFNTNGGASSLDPFGYAQNLGDGKNQFVYARDGNLYIPMGIKLIGAPNDTIASDTNYIINGGDKVLFRTDINYTAQQNVTVRVTGNGVTDTFAPITNNNGFAGYVYSGLPTSNNALGNHKVYFQVKTGGKPRPIMITTCETAHIQTFFKGTDFNHPNINAGDNILPNWAYYYYQLYSKANMQYDPNAVTSEYLPNTDQLIIASNAYQSYDMPVFSMRNNQLTMIGKLRVKGILRFIKTVGHELGHRLAAHAQPQLVTNNAALDSDGDGLIDSREAAYGLDSTKVDTATDGFSGLANYTDAECLADIVALRELIAFQQLWKSDWNTDGVQFGQLRWPVDQTQWEYYSYNSTDHTFPDTPTSTIPAEAIQLANTIQF